IWTYKGKFESRRSLLQFWLGYNMPQPSIFWRREVYERTGLLDETLYYVMDFDYWVRIAEHFDFQNVDRLLSHATYHERAKTGDNGVRSSHELRKHCCKYWGSRLSLNYWRLAASLFWYERVVRPGLDDKHLRAVKEIVSQIPEGGSFILVDDENLAID